MNFTPCEKNGAVEGFALVKSCDKKNAKNSSIIEVINLIKLDNIEIIIYDPEIKNLNIPGTTFISDLQTFKKKAEIILANRKSSELNDVLEKIYSKDIFGE